MRNIRPIYNDKIPRRQTDINALAEWANTCERKLLGLHCGVVLDRTRHREWAERIIDK